MTCSPGDGADQARASRVRPETAPASQPAKPPTEHRAPLRPQRRPRTATRDAGASARREAHDARQQLAQFAASQAKSPLGARASLALGYYDFKQKRFPEAREWLEKAAADPLLSDYALYWTAMTDRATGANPAALAEFQQYRQRYSRTA